MSRPLLAVALVATLAGSSPALAQSTRIAVGSIEAAQKCNYFREYDMRAGFVATPWYLAAASRIRSWIVKDCEAQFPGLKRSLEGALAASPVLQLASGGYRVDLGLTEVSDGGGAPAVPVGAGVNDYSASQAWMTVSLSFTVRDARGVGIYGGTLTKKVETGFFLSAGGTTTRGSVSDEAAYGMLQNEVAKAVARAVSFKIEPLRVVTTDGPMIELNYGRPFLELGSVVLVQKTYGIGTIKYRVTSASDGHAVAEMDGDFPDDSVAPGAEATFVEADDAAANGRRYPRSRLP